MPGGDNHWEPPEWRTSSRGVGLGCLVALLVAAGLWAFLAWGACRVM